MNFSKSDASLQAQQKLTDDQLLHKAAALLGISEFQLFADAWQAWYDETPSEKKMEPYFVDFLENSLVPFWVRSHVRMILSNKELLERESKRLLIGTITYYGPLLAFFVLLMWYLMKG